MKNAEMTTQQIVMLVILIVSFIVILIFIFLLDFSDATQQEVCRNSVVLKGKSSGLASSLDCKTEYVCISGGGDCENFNYNAKIEVDSENKTELMTAIADKMAECWWMFGEGKINYGTAGGESVKYAVCSVIKFDNSLGQLDKITYEEFYSFLEQNNKGDKTYLEYLYGVKRRDLFEFSEDRIKIDLGSDFIDFSKKYSIVTGIDDDPISSDNIFHVYLIPSDETDSRLDIGSNEFTREFITKA